ncbi:MAG: CoA transferase [Chloroflexi bacterium]|nr:CoA transferase [Chloroflexota bacterium]
MINFLSTTVLPGYRVLDLTDEKGMFCARILADMGAEVIRIEKPGEAHGDMFYQVTNPGKHIVSFDISNQRGIARLKRLVRTADILVESYAPGFLEKLGLDFPNLSKINPKLIMASITGFGQTGPYRDYKASDLVVSALGGQMYVNGETDSPPLKPHGNQTYYTGSLFAAIGIMLALWQRHTSGKGQHIDISLQECAAATLDHVLVRYFAEGGVAKRQGSLYWNNAFRIFPCRDGYILLTLFQQWETLVEWLDSEGMADDLLDRKYLNAEVRRAEIQHIIEVFERWTHTHTVGELVEKGQLMRFPWAEVSPVSKALENPQLRKRGLWEEVTVSGRKRRIPRTIRWNK